MEDAVKKKKGVTEKLKQSYDFDYILNPIKHKT